MKKKLLCLLIVIAIAAIAQQAQTHIRWQQMQQGKIPGTVMVWTTSGFTLATLDASLSLVDDGSGAVTLKANIPPLQTVTRKTQSITVTQITSDPYLTPVVNGPSVRENMDVFRNGVMQTEIVDYTYDTNTKIVSWVFKPTVGDIVTIKWIM